MQLWHIKEYYSLRGFKDGVGRIWNPRAPCTWVEGEATLAPWDRLVDGQ